MWDQVLSRWGSRKCAPLRTLLACSGSFLLSALVSFSFFFSFAGTLADALPLSDADTTVDADVLATGVDVLAIETEVLRLVLGFKASRWGKKLAGACQGYMPAEYMLASCE